MIISRRDINFARLDRHLVLGFAHGQWRTILKKPGQRFVWKKHADVLEKIASTKGKAFYRGVLAEKTAFGDDPQGDVASELVLRGDHLRGVLRVVTDVHLRAHRRSAGAGLQGLGRADDLAGGSRELELPFSRARRMASRR